MRDLVQKANALVSDEEPEKARPPYKADLRRRKKAHRSNMQEALGLYEEAVRRRPEDERGYCGAAVALMATGRSGDAARYLERLIRLRPGAAYPRGLMGCVMESAGKMEEAAACYGKMVELDPDEMFGRLRKAVVLSMLGRDGQARECMDELFAAEPASGPAAEARDRISAMLECDGPEEGGVNAELMPGLAAAWKTLVSKGRDPRRNIRKGRPGGGRKTPAPQGRDPRRAEAHRIKAMDMIRRGEHRKAIECLDAVLRLQPGGAADLGMKGMLLEKTGRVDEALECYERVIEAEPGEMMARRLKCGALARRGEAEKVLECYRAAMEAEPSDANDARIQEDMRAAYSELARRVDEAGSVRSGFAEFAKSAGYSGEP